MVSLKRTGGKGTENTTYTAGYALHFTCKMKRCIAVMLNLCSPCTSKKDLSRHPVYSYNMLYKMLYITCYIGHDPVRNYICYITNYLTFFGYVTYYTGKMCCTWYNKSFIAIFSANILGLDPLLGSIIPFFCYIGNKWLINQSCWDFWEVI